ncbi:MAG: hypothetical protein KC586_10305 [Myxococcales bacterium]|nr:hypothetical protein [Myxococcales bacterium]
MNGRTPIWILALPMLACGGPPSAATERPSVAPEPPPSQSEARVEADVEPTHADPVVPGEDATSVRVRETIASVGARVVAVETTSDGGPPVVDVELGATRLRTPVAWEAVGALRAIATVEHLRARGIAPMDVRALRDERVWISSELRAVNAALVRRPWWLVAPTRRRGMSPPDALGPPTREVEGTGNAMIDALRVDATTSVMLVGEVEELSSSSAVCVAHPDVVRCVAARYARIEGLTGAWEGAARALVVSTVGGSTRDGGRALLFVAENEERVVTSELLLGAMTGDGERCEHEDSYCVYVEAIASDARWVADRCVELDAPERWAATHVRVGDRWRDVDVSPGPPCVRRFSVGPEGPRRERCGPTGGRPECSDVSAVD